MVKLNLASLSKQQTEKIRVITHPILPSLFKSQKYIINAGAIPKLTKSVRESNSLQNSVVPFISRAILPSKASSIEEIIVELLESKHSERQGRLIDSDQIGSMEIKKQDGYF